MADSIVARQQGDDFQARLFWLHATLLLDEASPVRRVLFETGPRAFDDVVVDYDAKPQRCWKPSSPKTGWYWIGNALKERHKVLTQYPALALESAWYPQVHKEMLRRAHSQEGLARIRMERAAELMGIPKAAPTASLERASTKAPVKPKAAVAVPAATEKEAGAVRAKPKRARKKPE